MTPGAAMPDVDWRGALFVLGRDYAVSSLFWGRTTRWRRRVIAIDVTR